MTQEPGSGVRARSRPGGRTARVSEQVLDATVELIARHGVAAVTYDAVAQLAGSSRATVYRKWPRRDDLLRAALTRFAEVSVSVPDTGDVRSDLVELLCAIGGILATPTGRAIINASITADDDDPIRALGLEVLRTRLAVLEARIAGAVEAGELPPTDASFLNTMLVAPVHLHVMRDRRPLTREFAERVVRTVFDGVVPRES
ncbi:TetR/AcrR family transcriptional regulator [Streptomyces sp. WAC 00631]|uniref:TetR/AcrR family transcriptional regulator n=1 Tax=unclassified Streptomyces TaxID=2593676 RepID=UPI000F767188|nr:MULTISPECIES: TetR/AcrR family transcriptional regulator [unclassified Streptomyces]MCC5033470.1 TetR/AcrR family transcriptional regulator [Streptomyces sp. WAC 00631]MCC9741558.1 TetR/AcrR family transcriptional regulator [Streptomyces sp. MNU89]